MPRKDPADPVVTELAVIKKLLILQLVTAGVQAKDVSKVLGLNKSDMSRLVPTQHRRAVASHKALVTRSTPFLPDRTPNRASSRRTCAKPSAPD